MKLNRIQLSFNRNLDNQTTKYRIYRADHPDVQKTDVVVMEIEHVKEIHPIKVIGEKLTMITPSIYAFEYEQIYTDEACPLTIYIDGANAMYETGFTLDFALGRLQFDNPTNKLVTADYYYDGFEVLDDDRKQEGVTFFGPIAKDYSQPNPPYDLTIDVEDGIVLRYKQGDTYGKDYYYRVAALDDVGHFSNLCNEVSIHVTAGLPKYPYIIECSKNHGLTWMISARCSELKYTEYGIDTTPPDAIMNLVSYVQLNHGLSSADVILNWDIAIDTSSGIESPMYRVRMSTEAGAVSEPSNLVGPVFVKTNLDRIVIRRKFYNGSIPSLHGNDAETVATLSPSTTSYVDTVTDNSEYVYSFFVLDQAGNVSISTTLQITIDDATAPYMPTINLRPVDLVY